MIITYPPESLPILWHVLAMAIATILTVIGLYLGYRWKRSPAIVSEAAGTWQDILSDIIPVSGIILALLSPLISAIFIPILDYHVSQGSGTTTHSLQITINNIGFVRAENVQLYLSSDGVNFTNFTSKPVIYNGTTSLSSDKLNEIGSGIFYISSLPPKSETMIIASVNRPLGNDDKIVAYLRSDSSVGFHNVVTLTLAYLIFASILSINTGYIVATNWNPKRVDLLVIANGIATFLIFITLFVGTCEGKLDCGIAPNT